LLNGNKPTDAIIQKAVDHAKSRIESGKSPFASNSIREDIGSLEDVQAVKSFALKQKNLMNKAAVETRNASVNDEYLNIINGKSSFEQIDGRVASGEYNAKDAQFLKSMFVKIEPVKDDKLTIGRYLDALNSLPIDDQIEAQKVRESIMGDAGIKDNTKAVLLYGKNLGGGNLSLGEMDVPKDADAGHGFAIWTHFRQKANRDDAVDAFLKFRKSLDGSETPMMLKKRAQRAISDVAIERNPGLADLGSDWTGMVDGNGTEFMARMNEDGEIETQENQSTNDQTTDQDNDNAD
jgi:hypothetical protein